MELPKNVFTISGNTIVNNNNEVKDLSALNDKTISADTPDTNDFKLKWIVDENNDQIQIRSELYPKYYVGAYVNDKGVCQANLSKSNNNTWFEKVKDGTTNEVFVALTQSSPDCFNTKYPKYLTMGDVNQNGDIPITFEEEKPTRKRSTQKWKFTKASTEMITE